jgi:hypothetical protein
VDELFLLPLREFTAARDRLAAQLVAAKQRDRAREVKELQRPTVAAWVVNQLAHRHRAAVRRLLDAGAVLRRAQYALGRRRSADDFRAATKRRQETLRELRALAAQLLREAGSAAHLDAVLATLEAASVDPAAAKAVTTGRLSRELPRPAGFGDAAQLALLPSGTTAPTRPAAEPKPAGAKRQHARKRAMEARRLEREAAQAEQAAKRAAQRGAILERGRGELEQQVQELREELQAAEGRLHDADGELARVRAEESAASEHARALRRRTVDE